MMIERLARFTVRRRAWVLLAILVVTVLLGLQIRNLQIVINSSTMLPASHPNVLGTTVAEALFGSRHVIVVGVSQADGGSAWTPQVLDTVRRLTDRLGALAQVKRHTLLSLASDKAKSIQGDGDALLVERLLPGGTGAADIAQARARLAANPVYQGTLMSQDDTVATVSFSVNAGASGFRAAVDAVEQVIAAERQPGIELRASGMPVFLATVERYAQRMAFLFPLALLLIGLIHYEAFRTIQGLALPLVTAILAVIWGLGIMGAARVPMDAFNSTTPILILAVAAGHAVQILKRYYEEFERLAARVPATFEPGDASNAAAQRARRRLLNDQAIIESLTRVAPVMLTAGLVAACGFFSLVTFQIATIRTFGIFTGLGILSALLIELTFIPALRSLLPPPRPTGPASGSRAWDRLADGLSALIGRRRHLILAGFAVLALVCVLAIPQVNRENSTKGYFGAKVPLILDDAFLNQRLAGTNTVYVVLQGKTPDRMKDPAILQLIEQAQREIEKNPLVGKTLSIVDFIGQMNRSMNGPGAGVDRVPAQRDTVSQYLLLYSMSGDPTDFDAYIDYDYRNACLVIWTRSDSSRFADQIVADIRGWLGPRLPADVTMQIGGSVPQTAALSDVLVDGKIRNIVQMIAAVFLAGALVFRSWVAGLYLIVPLVVTVMVNFAVMALTGIPLNTPNSVNSAMAIGIGADYAIYLLYRVREEYARSGDYQGAVRECLRTAGKAVLYVASAIAAGYSVLMFSFGFYVHIWFGVLIVLSMIVSAVSALLLIPTLLLTWPPGFLIGRARRVAAVPAGVASVAVAALLAGLLAVSGEAVAQSPGADDVAQRAYLSTRVDSSRSEAVFTLTSANGQQRVRRTVGASKLAANGLDNRRMIRFLAPGDVRNTGTLIIENQQGGDEVMVYLPALKKVRRLAGANTRGSFVGTDLSYGDLVGYRPQDWRHQLLRSEPCGDTGAVCHVLESAPRSPAIADDAGYSRRINWVRTDNLVPVRTEFYDLNGRLLKTMDSSELKQVDAGRNRWQAMRVSVANHQTGHQTLIQLEKFSAGMAVPDEEFTARFLEKEQ